MEVGGSVWKMLAVYNSNTVYDIETKSDWVVGNHIAI